MKEPLKLKVDGHVLIKAGDEVLFDGHNAIHPSNISIAIARGLSNTPRHQIYKMKLGNQGTYIDSSQQVVFRPPNVAGASADLYNPTYVEVVDDTESAVGAGNSVTFTAIPSTTSTRVIVSCVISANEAVNRATDTADGGTVDTEGNYFFDELGLFSAGSGAPSLINEDDELMLSHLIFSPIEHTGNRELTVVYTLTITAS